MKLRRGFKTEANSLARALRSELGLRFDSPLNPWRLAEHLEIPVFTLSEMRNDAPVSAHLFSTSASNEFSAVTVFDGTRRVIVHNDSHSYGRQASNIAHEIAHGILLHTPGLAIDEKGCRIWNRTMEEEAEWLGGALLISEEAAIAIVARKMTVDQAVEFYGVSKKMVNWRLGVTGARTRLERKKQFFGGRA